MSRTSGFQFVEDLDRTAIETMGVVEIPAGVAHKQQLMQGFAQSVPFPDYFGCNWDALDECLRDRLFDELGPPLCLLHRDLPLEEDETECRHYLALLEDTLAWAQETATCEFTVVFPVDALEAIARLGIGNERP